jgi:pimeloyl-ACP methyl ester carboxylesterase
VLLLHGFGDDLHTWDQLVGEWGESVLAARPDLPGHGGSTRFGSEPADHTREVALGLVEELVAELTARSGNDQVVVVGHSLGGYLALCHAIRHPETVAGLGLIATGPGFRRDDARAKWNAMIDKATSQFGLAPEVAPLCRQDDALVLDNLDELTMPIVQLVGSNDTHYFAGMEVVEERTAQATSVHLEGGRHHVHRTHARQVTEALMDLLN